MRSLLPCVIFFHLLFCSFVHSQSLPVMADTAIHVAALMDVKPDAVRMAKNPVNNALYYATAEGNLYRIRKISGVYSDTLIASVVNHNINYLTGIIFRDSNIYLIGNRLLSGSLGYGLIVRGKFQSGGSFIWDTIMHTASYPNSGTLFDHSFSCISLSYGGDSLYFSSGSRTDHGEIQTAAGLFPGKRDVGLTGTIFRIPVNPATTIYLPNDSSALLASGYVFCRGTRNSFDLQIAPNGDLLGCENSGDRDDPDELNWLQQGKHYGFPWKMGGNLTGMQFPTYNQNTDLLINHQSSAWKKGYFYNDPAYPPQPVGITFTEPVKNFGPDADKFRDPVTGLVRDASDEGSYLTSFTSHRSPLGLVFDVSGKLAAPYYHSAFMLSYTQGTTDSSGTMGNKIGPFCDTGQDLLQLALFKDTVTGQYSMNCYRIASSFIKPVDAYLDNNVLYVLETHQNDSVPKAKLYTLTFPLNNSVGSCPFLGNDTSICKGASVTLKPNLKGQFMYLWSTGATTSQITVAPSSSTYYWLRVSNGIITSTDTINITTMVVPAATITTTGPLTFCSGTTPLTLTANTGTGFTYKWKKGTTYIAAAVNQSYNPASTGSYRVEVTNPNGCSKLSAAKTVTVNALPPATITALGPTTFCAGDSVVLAANTGAGLTYKWKKGTTIISGATSNNYTAKTAGTYKVIVSNTSNCSKTSSGKVITINCRSGIGITDHYIEVYPNPTDKLLTLKINSVENENCMVTIKDVTGRTVMTLNIVIAAGESVQSFDISSLIKGVYMMELKTKSFAKTIRVIKE